jgi:imidazolonepropionase-like amidohydrolase
MDGFTSVRKMGGPLFAVRRSIDSGLIIGPRLYPSGAFISQTSGHGDFRDRGDPGFSPNDAGDRSNIERYGIGTVADGVPEVLKATRLNLRNGATQIKIMAGGGGSSRFDPIDTTQYSEAEIKAVVGAAEDWGTYVAAHVFTDRAVNACWAAASGPSSTASSFPRRRCSGLPRKGVTSCLSSGVSRQIWPAIRCCPRIRSPWSRRWARSTRALGAIL